MGNREIKLNSRPGLTITDIHSFWWAPGIWFTYRCTEYIKFYGHARSVFRSWAFSLWYQMLFSPQAETIINSKIPLIPQFTHCWKSSQRRTGLWSPRVASVVSYQSQHGVDNGKRMQLRNMLPTYTIYSLARLWGSYYLRSNSSARWWQMGIAGPGHDERIFPGLQIEGSQSRDRCSGENRDPAITTKWNICSDIRATLGKFVYPLWPWGHEKNVIKADLLAYCPSKNSIHWETPWRLEGYQIGRHRDGNYWFWHTTRTYQLGNLCILTELSSPWICPDGWYKGGNIPAKAIGDFKSSNRNSLLIWIERLQIPIAWGILQPRLFSVVQVDLARLIAYFHIPDSETKSTWKSR